MLLAPLLHAAALAHQEMNQVLNWLDTRDFEGAEQRLERAGIHTAAAQLRSVLLRDSRNRESTVMSASSLLHAYRYPCVAQAAADDLTPAAFLDGNNTIYIVAGAHHQHDLQPVILALITSIYEAAIEASRHRGPFHPPLDLLLDETANIAPIRDLAPWLSQCGDHGITIATSWQSLAQIDRRYGKSERDAILAGTPSPLSQTKRHDKSLDSSDPMTKRSSGSQDLILPRAARFEVQSVVETHSDSLKVCLTAPTRVIARASPLLSLNAARATTPTTPTAMSCGGLAGSRHPGWLRRGIAKHTGGSVSAADHKRRRRRIRYSAPQDTV